MSFEPISHRADGATVDALAEDGALYTLAYENERGWTLLTARVDDLTFPASAVSREAREAVESWANDSRELSSLLARWTYAALQEAYADEVAWERGR